MTLLMFICTVSCFKLMANTTKVSHGAPCWPVAFPFLLREGVDVFVTESAKERKTDEAQITAVPQISSLHIKDVISIIIIITGKLI